VRPTEARIGPIPGVSRSSFAVPFSSKIAFPALCRLVPQRIDSAYGGHALPLGRSYKQYERRPVRKLKGLLELGLSKAFQPSTHILLIFGLLLSMSAPCASAQASAGTDTFSGEFVPACKILYAGFVGAMETSSHKASGVVQLRDILRGPGYSDVCAESFMPVAWKSCRDWILSRFPKHPGPLTEAEKAESPRIILVGHSTGGWAVLKVAREFRDKSIAVELTVQLDSVGVTDRTVPRNVKSSAIFHAWDMLMFLTTKNIRLEDPLHTRLIANVVVKNASHLSITRDPRIRDLVLSTILAVREEMAAIPGHR